MSKVNSEGLTFAEWFAAANCFDRNAVSIVTAEKAWANGDDPTEYAAAAQNKPVKKPVAKKSPYSKYIVEQGSRFYVAQWDERSAQYQGPLRLEVVKASGCTGFFCRSENGLRGAGGYEQFKENLIKVA